MRSAAPAQRLPVSSGILRSETGGKKKYLIFPLSAHGFGKSFFP